MGRLGELSEHLMGWAAGAGGWLRRDLGVSRAESFGGAW